MVGKYAGGWMVEHKKILKAGHIEQGRRFFTQHGGKSILIGRFVGLVRPMVPLIAGSMHMRIQTFIFWNILGAFLWSALYLTLGFFFGAYAHQIHRVIYHAGFAIAGILVSSAILYYIYICSKKETKHGSSDR
jgi:undecaprenyl-diphosphatase